MQKFGQARANLMLPHREGVVRAIVLAGYHSEQGLEELEGVVVDEAMFHHIETLKAHLALSADKSPEEVAADMTDDEIASFANAVDELANYCAIEVFGA
jgi:hypothetical protein